ncbi:hypothetical protein PI126_g1427 [Phytophthora idaei]|nr:hypothetical protein PI126_g1427 [Phytophthora idaei]
MILNANACSAKEDEAATSRENSHVEGTIWITKLAPAIECIACVMSRAALLARQDPELLLVVYSTEFDCYWVMLWIRRQFRWQTRLAADPVTPDI